MWDGLCGIKPALQCIRDTYGNTSNDLSAIAENLAGRERIYFVGCGTSYYNSVAAQFVFNRIAGMDASAVYALEFAEFLPGNLKRCAVVGISHTGGTGSVIAALEAAKAGGAYTVAVTDVEGSALSAAAGTCLPGYGGREPSLPKTRSYLAALMKLYYLAAATARLKGRETCAFLECLGKTPEKAGAFLKRTEEPMRALAANPYKAVYLFGRGINLGSVSEAALKLQETAQLISIPFELEEGMHGPWVTMNSGDLAAILHFNGPYHDKSLKLVKALEHLGLDMLVIGNDPSFHEKVKQCILIDEDEWFSPFYTVLPFYQLAYFAALQKGHNPDFMRLWEAPYLAVRLNLPR
jgi:glucosamine--fructose-6-phosphate aminotransferase (isomerizing)